MKKTFNPYLYQAYSCKKLAEFVLNEKTKGVSSMPFIRRLNSIRKYGSVEEKDKFIINRAEQVAMQELKRQTIA